MKRSSIVVVFLFCFINSYAQKSLNGLIMIPDSTIKESKQLLHQNDAETLLSFSHLKALADEALQAKTTSVMDKDIVPPSGDKHDYISQGPYWWPDPNKSDGLPYIRKDGVVNPEIRKFKDHDNMKVMFKNVDILSKAYFLSDETTYAKKAIELIRVWFINSETKMNPHLEYGQGIPGRTIGRSIGIIETPGLAKVVNAIVLLKNTYLWTESDENSMQAWMSAYLDWLLNSSHGKKEAIHPNNHGTWYDVQVGALAIYTGQKETLLDITEKAKSRRFETHIASDGEQPHETARTKGYSYSVMNLMGLMQTARLAEKVDIDLWNYKNAKGVGLKDALDYLLPFALKKKELPFKQISPLKPERLLPHLWMAYKVYEEPKYLQAYQAIVGKKGEDLSPLFY